jgi:molybdopterin-guanine dinucleotide biosynthesis protein A
MGMNPSTIVTAILAGGHGRRLDGAVKATLVVAGRPLLSRLVAKLEAQSSVSVLCVAPRHVAIPWVKAADLPIAVDPVDDGGPLAGVAAAMAWARATIHSAHAVVTVPVDVPFVPDDLVARLAEAAPPSGIAVAESGTRRHHAVAYWPLSLTDELEATVKAGEPGAIHRWQARHPVAHVSWPTEPFDPFFNINTPEDLRAAAQIAAMIDAHSPPSA